MARINGSSNYFLGTNGAGAAGWQEDADAAGNEVRREHRPADWAWNGERFSAESEAACKTLWPGECPYGKPGDRLWVKETWHHAVPIGVPTTTSDYQSSLYVDYRADVAEQIQPLWKWKSPMFIPRWASRITLEISGVRVERLQNITEPDAIAEGIKRLNGRYTFNEGLHESRTAKESYQALWESINGAGSWDANPWVWALTFRMS